MLLPMVIIFISLMTLDNSNELEFKVMMKDESFVSKSINDNIRRE